MRINTRENSAGNDKAIDHDNQSKEDAAGNDDDDDGDDQSQVNAAGKVKSVIQPCLPLLRPDFCIEQTLRVLQFEIESVVVKTLIVLQFYIESIVVYCIEQSLIVLH